MQYKSNSTVFTAPVSDARKCNFMPAADIATTRIHIAASVEKAESSEDPYALTVALQKAAAAYKSFGDFAQAYALALRVEELATRYDFDRELACAHVQLGGCLVSVGNYEKALPHLKAGLKIYTALAHHDGTLVALKALGRFHLAQGQYELMFAYVKEALKVFRPAETDEDYNCFFVSVAEGHAHYAAALMADGKAFEASTQVSKAFRFLNSRADIGMQRTVSCTEGQLLDILARLNLLRDQPAQSASCAFILLRSSRQFGSFKLLGQACDRFADIRIREGKHRGALRWLMRAKTCWERLDMHRERVLSLERLSDCFANLQQHEMALKFLKAARRLDDQARCSQAELRAEMMAIEMSAERAQRDEQEAQEHNHRLALLGRMILNVTHEVTQPISAIRLLAENALLATGACAHRDDAPSLIDSRESLVRIVQLTDVLMRYTDHLKRFTRRDPTQVSPTSLMLIVNDAVAISEPKRKSCIASLTIDVDDVTVMSNPGSASAILVNLLCNAFDAVSETSQRKVYLDARQTADRVQIRIRDYGYGLSSETLARLFEPFYTTKTAGKGSGLGLRLSMDLAHQMGATLEGGNHPEGGAEFILNMQKAPMNSCTEKPAGTFVTNTYQPNFLTQPDKLAPRWFNLEIMKCQYCRCHERGANP